MLLGQTNEGLLPFLHNIVKVLCTLGYRVATWNQVGGLTLGLGQVGTIDVSVLSFN